MHFKEIKHAGVVTSPAAAPPLNEIHCEVLPPNSQQLLTDSQLVVTLENRSESDFKISQKCRAHLCVLIVVFLNLVLLLGINIV